jgi:hypothetical protein
MSRSAYPKSINRDLWADASHVVMAFNLKLHELLENCETIKMNDEAKVFDERKVCSHTYTWFCLSP